MKARITAVSCALVAVALLQLPAAQPAAAYPSANVDLVGHGFGHGRGMSQWGSLGYAVDHGLAWERILDVYYSNTHFGDAGNPTIGVELVSAAAKDTIITNEVGFWAGPKGIGPGDAARIRKVGANTFDIEFSNGCAGEGGGWRNKQTVTGPVHVYSVNPGDSVGQMLTRCDGAGNRAYRGVLDVIDHAGTQRVVNSLPVEQYLRGVVPRESPASWADVGGGRGAEALRAQSVAARSYLLAGDNRRSYATTCDTTACQVYGGAYLNGVRIEDNRTDAAIAFTAGKVREMNSNGAVARTEFSSSSGGHTAGGTFPAVVDEGDDIAGNPNHNWTASIPVSTVESAYPGVGSLQSIQITGRNGLGDMGGRVTAMILNGTSGSVPTNGADFRAKLGLKSDWFQVQGTPSGGTNGYWLAGSDGGVFSFGNAGFHGSMGGQPLAAPIVNMADAPDFGGYWLIASDGGVFSFGSSRFHGSMGGRPLNRPMVGLAPTAGGAGYWTVASDGGVFAFDAAFHGSMGGRPLNRPIVAMAPTPSGNGYWLVAADGGIFAHGDAAFHGSAGSLALRSPVVGMTPTSDGGGYWLVAADGGVFAYGSAGYFGSLPGSRVNATATGIARTQTGGGYMIVTDRGVVHNYGDAPQFGGIPNVAPGFRGRALRIAPVY